MKLKKFLISVCAGALTISAIASASSAETLTAKVSRTSSDTQVYNENSVSLKNFYDFGTWLPLDDAYISAQVINGSVPYAYIYYKPYGTGTWSSKGGYGYTSVYENPSGVDYLQGDSYAESRASANNTTYGIRLKVVD